MASRTQKTKKEGRTKARNVDISCAEHMVVNHGKDEYVSGECTTNLIEGPLSVFKRGMNGVEALQ